MEQQVTISDGASRAAEAAKNLREVLEAELNALHPDSKFWLRITDVGTGIPCNDGITFTVTYQ